MPDEEKRPVERKWSLMKQISKSQIRLAGLWIALMSAAGGWAQQQAIRINPGCSGSNFRAANGTVFLTDRYFGGSGDCFYNSDPVKNTPDSYLYRTARYGLYGDFEYNIPLVNGSYNLTLKFAEINYRSKGSRVFNVLVNGAKVLSNFDILNEVPSRTALDKTFPVNVTGGTMRIQFQGVVRRGIINAIEIVPVAVQPVTISVNPAQVSLSAGQTARFTATVGGASNTAVNWSASAGTIAADGTYAAPASIPLAATATVTATCQANSSSKATAIVSLTAPAPVPVPPVLTLSTASLAFSAVAGTTPAAQAFTVANSGGAGMSWTASASGSWLKITPASGTNAGTVTASVNTAGLVAGSYTGSITVAAAATGSPKAVAVTLSVSAPVQPVLSISPASLTYTGQAGGSSPAAQSVSISNTGNGALNWIATKTQGWLTLSAASGTAPSTLSLSASLTGMAAGSYTNTVTISSSGATGSPKTLSVTFNVQSPPPANGAGTVILTKRTQSGFDTYTNSTNPAIWQWMRDHYDRMCVFAPYFNSKTSQYPNGWIYQDSYAIYNGDALVNQHPEWILKDASGNRLYIPYGCGGGACPQYAADFSNPAFRQYWVDTARLRLSGGIYKGLWIDDVNLDWRVGDGNGNSVNPIDPHTGQAMTLDNYRLYFAQFMEKVRADLPTTEILHNSIWYAGGDSGRDANPYIKRQLQAADVINIEFGVNDGGLSGGTGEWSLSAVLSFIDRLNAMGKKAVIEGIAGGDANNTVALEYAIANYFLVSNGANAAGDYANVTTPDQFWAGFNVNLGTPAGARYNWNSLMRRDFSGGMVLVNEPQAATRTVTLPGRYHKVDGTAVTSVTLGASRGVILTN